MTTRLYYHDSFLYDFDAEVREVLDNPRPALVLDRTAFYPTSGGQVFDTGWITTDADAKLRVTEVADAEDGRVVHYLETLSDLNTPTLSKEQIESAEHLANEIILENRAVDVRFVTRDEAGKLGLRKLPPTERDELRLIDIRDFDLTACGGTHVSQTGQIASVLLRKTEKVRQGWRVEFVAGQRAVATARRDFSTLTETSALFSAHIYDVPTQARKALDEIKSLRKQREQSLEELAAAQAAALLAETPEQGGRRLIVRSFADRELNFLKLLAQKLTRQSPNAIALLATTSPQPSLVFAQSANRTTRSSSSTPAAA